MKSEPARLRRKDDDRFGAFDICVIAYMLGITTGSVLVQMGWWL